MSSVIPERIIQNTIVRGIRNLRQNPRLIAGLFGHLSDSEFDSIVRFISETHPTMHINYPRAELTPPAMILLLKSENEKNQFLGDQMGTAPHYGLPDSQFQYDGSTTAASTTNLSGLTRNLCPNVSILSGSTSSVEVVVDGDWIEFVEDNPPLPAKLHVIDGTGKGKVYIICQIKPGSIDIEGEFEVELDSTSVVDIRSADTSELIEGTPSRGLDPNARITRLGNHYEVTYQLDIVAGSQEQVIYLYNVVKSLFFLDRKFIESQGLISLRTSGSDFAPRSEFLPDEVFHRVLNLTFEYPFAIFKEEQEPGNLSFVLNVSDPVTQDEIEAFSQLVKI